jgi:hypothetical protein
MTREETEECIKLAVEGCKKVYEMQKEALKKKYGMIQGEAEAEAEPEEAPAEETQEPEERLDVDEPEEDEKQ